MSSAIAHSRWSGPCPMIGRDRRLAGDRPRVGSQSPSWTVSRKPLPRTRSISLRDDRVAVGQVRTGRCGRRRRSSRSWPAGCPPARPRRSADGAPAPRRRSSSLGRGRGRRGRPRRRGLGRRDQARAVAATASAPSSSRDFAAIETMRHGSCRVARPGPGPLTSTRHAERDSGGRIGVRGRGRVRARRGHRRRSFGSPAGRSLAAARRPAYASGPAERRGARRRPRRPSRPPRRRTGRP